MTKKQICNLYRISYPTLRRRLIGSGIECRKNLLSAKDVKLIVKLMGKPDFDITKMPWDDE